MSGETSLSTRPAALKKWSGFLNFFSRQDNLQQSHSGVKEKLTQDPLSLKQAAASNASPNRPYPLTIQKMGINKKSQPINVISTNSPSEEMNPHFQNGSFGISQTTLKNSRDETSFPSKPNSSNSIKTSKDSHLTLCIIKSNLSFSAQENSMAPNSEGALNLQSISDCHKSSQSTITLNSPTEEPVKKLVQDSKKKPIGDSGTRRNAVLFAPAEFKQAAQKHPPQLQTSKSNDHQRRRSFSAGYHQGEHRGILKFHAIKETTVVSPHDSVSEGGQVNQYRIISEIGEGAFGKVFRCYDQDSKINYALKVVSKSKLRRKMFWFPKPKPPPMSSDSKRNPRETERDDYIMSVIKREIAILKKVSNHPHIATLVEVLDDNNDDIFFSVMELCDRPIIKLELHDKVEPIPEEKMLKYFREIVAGLEYLHHCHIIHCDIKPDNILLSMDDEAKITDLGVSQIYGEDDKLTVYNSSPAFCPPETCYISRQGFINGQPADIWSLGVTMYCCVFGSCPFQADGMIEMYEQIANKTPTYQPAVSEELSGLIKGMLFKNPFQRITLNEIRDHSWVTVNGNYPMISKQENCGIFEGVTEEDVKTAVRPALSLIHKIKFIWRRPKSSSTSLTSTQGQQQQSNSSQSLEHIPASSPPNSENHARRESNASSIASTIRPAAPVPSKSLSLHQRRFGGGKKLNIALPPTNPLLYAPPPTAPVASTPFSPHAGMFFSFGRHG